jgi:hypothetical protein
MPVDGFVRGFAAAKMAIEPTVSNSTRSNDASRISPRPSWVSPRLSKVPRRPRQRLDSRPGPLGWQQQLFATYSRCVDAQKRGSGADTRI